MDFLRLFIKLQKQKEKDNFQLVGVSLCRHSQATLVSCRGESENMLELIGIWSKEITVWKKKRSLKD